MVNIRTATPQINRFGTDAERDQSSLMGSGYRGEIAGAVEQGVISGKTTPSRRFRARAGGE
jgi:hypothetical protein